MFMYKSVIFDLDGTLLDTLQDIRLAFNDALEAAGLPLSYSLKEVRNMIGKGADYLCHTGLGKFDNEENFLKLKGEYMWRYEKYQVEHTKPYPGIYETLLFLKERGIQLFVCSNKPDKLASEILSHCFKSQLFVYVQGHLENFPPKPHPASLNKIIMYISGIIIPLGCLLAWNNYTLTSDITETIKKTGASLVSMIPSGLFLLLSTTLTVAVLALAKRKTMVQDSYAIESLARCDVICLDKTGTITDGTMRLEKEIKLTDKRIDIKKLMGSFVSAFQDDKNVTMEALTKAYPETKTHKIKVVLPFSSSRKLSAVEFEKTGTFVLGAPEFITKDKKVLSRSEEFAKEGFRVLLLAYTNEPLSEQSTFFKVEPYALLVLSDHIRDEAYDTIKWFNENNMEVKIISGDNPQTVSQIALKAGVLHGDRYISLEGLSNDEVSTFANQYTVFGRVSPEQKAVLIKALKNNNRTVAMTGDGVNDTLALKEADCSIAMADGSEVARNISHLVLLNSNFSSLPSVVEEGRKVINNVQKSSTLFFRNKIHPNQFTFSCRKQKEDSLNLSNL